MKTKLSFIVALTITSLNAEVISKYVFTNPLPGPFKSTDNGGTKAAIDAYKDIP